MFRLMFGRTVDTLTLARNARTSPEMLNRFYAAPLQGQMNVGELQSKRRPGPWESRVKVDRRLCSGGCQSALQAVFTVLATCGRNMVAASAQHERLRLVSLGSLRRRGVYQSSSASGNRVPFSRVW